jgi:hypothetical protein
MLSFQPLTLEETIRVIGRSSNKTSDLDPMPSNWVKAASEQLAPVTQCLLNTSLSQGVFPGSMKTAIVVPRLKKATLDPSSYGNFRPVSNLCFISKVLEKVVADQLARHLEE